MFLVIIQDADLYGGNWCFNSERIHSRTCFKLQNFKHNIYKYDNKLFLEKCFRRKRKTYETKIPFISNMIFHVFSKYILLSVLRDAYV